MISMPEEIYWDSTERLAVLDCSPDLDFRFVAIKGTRDILRDGSWIIHKGNVDVIVGDVINFDIQVKDPWGRALNLCERTREKILENVDEPSIDKAP